MTKSSDGAGEGENATERAASVLEPLAKRLFMTRPRERFGGRMTARVEYQKHWAMCEMLSRYERGEDFCFVFEFHDDVMVLDRPNDPEKAAFFQVKTRADKKGPMPLRELLKTTKRKKGGTGSEAQASLNTDEAEDQESATDGLRAEDPQADQSDFSADADSTLAKLFENRAKFRDDTTGLVIVSNQAFKLCVKKEYDPDLESIPFEALCDAEQDQILKHLQGVFGADLTLDDLSTLRFVHCTLSLRDMDRNAMGRFIDYFERHLKRPVAVAALYRALYSDISNRTGREDPLADFEEMRRMQSMSRGEFHEHLSHAAAAKDPEADLEDLKTSLAAAGWTPWRLRRFRTAWREYQIDRTNFDRPQTQEARSAIAPVVESILRADLNVAPVDLIAKTRARLEDAGVQLPSSLTEDFKDAIILFEANESHGRIEVSEANKKSEEEAA